MEVKPLTPRDLRDWKVCLNILGWCDADISVTRSNQVAGVIAAVWPIG